MQDTEKAAEIIKRYKDIIKTKKKGIINDAFYQRQIFKRFKEKERFAKLVSLLKSSIGLGFFKNYHKYIKAICKENERDFQ